MSKETEVAFDAVMNELEVLMNEVRRDGNSNQAKELRAIWSRIDAIRDAILTT